MSFIAYRISSENHDIQSTHMNKELKEKERKEGNEGRSNIYLCTKHVQTQCLPITWLCLTVTYSLVS